MKISKKGEITIAGACIIVLFTWALARSAQLISRAVKEREEMHHVIRVNLETNSVNSVTNSLVNPDDYVEKD